MSNKDDIGLEFKRNLLAIIDEAFRDAPEPRSAYFLDQDGNWEASLRNLSVADASRQAIPGAMTVAEQVGHTAYYLESFLRLVAGETEPPDWPSSWQTTVTDAAQWAALQSRLFTAFAAVRELVEANDDWSYYRTGGAMAVAMHSVYHLGAVRQLLKALKHR